MTEPGVVFTVRQNLVSQVAHSVSAAGYGWALGECQTRRRLSWRPAIPCGAFQTFPASMAYKFSPPSTLETGKGFPFLRPSSLWKPVVPADHGEGRGMQQAPPTHFAHLHPRCCIAAGSGQAVLPATIPGLAGTAGSSPPLTKCF